MLGFLIVVASLVAEQGLQAHGFQWLPHLGSVVGAHGPSFFVACGIFPEQGSNPCPLHWQEDSYPLHHQEVPYNRILNMVLCAVQ